MGSSQTTVQSGGSQSTTTPTPTAEETELNRLQLEREKFLDPQIRETQSKGLGLTSQLLTGSTELPGFLKGTLGISEAMQDQIVDESLRDITPGFQQSGLLDSGVRASISARTAADLRRATEEFNIGAKQNLLNLALSGQAQVQQPILGFSGQLGARLSGLRTISQTGTSYGSSTVTQRPSTMGMIGQGVGIAASAKLVMACVPEGEMIESADGDVLIENLKVGDSIFDGDGNSSNVTMIHQYSEEPTHNRFFVLKFDDGFDICTCDKHRIDGVAMGDLKVGDLVSGKKIIEKEPIKMEGRSFDIMTDSPDGSYMMSGVKINTMIPELAKLMEDMKEVRNG